MPIYVITETGSNGSAPKEHLVSAKTTATAIKTIAEPRFTARIATDADLIALTKAGVELVEAKPETK